MKSKDWVSGCKNCIYSIADSNFINISHCKITGKYYGWEHICKKWKYFKSV